MTCPSDIELARALSAAIAAAGAPSGGSMAGGSGSGGSVSGGSVSGSAMSGAGSPWAGSMSGGGSPSGGSPSGVAPELEAHLESCAACRVVWDDTRAMIELARELPVALPPPARREELRTALLAAGGLVADADAPARRARPAWLAPAVIAAAAAAVVIVYVAQPDRVPVAHAHGVVHPRPGARYVASQGAPDEIVWLLDGALDIEVAPLHPGERYRVMVGGAEVEVRGTAFTVHAHDNQLIDVAVGHGRVEVRPELGPTTTLGAGQSWHVGAARTASSTIAPMITEPPPGAPASAAADRARTTAPAAASAAGAADRARTTAAAGTADRALTTAASAAGAADHARTTAPTAASTADAARTAALGVESPGRAADHTGAAGPGRAADHAGTAASPAGTAATPARAADRAGTAASPALVASERARAASPPVAEASPPVAEASPQPAEASPPAPAIAPAATDPAPAASRASAEASYDDGWDALRSNDFVRASRSFARVLLLGPDSPLVEDASFWRAVALARCKRSVEACTAFRDFLDAFPRAARAGEASAMLGWLLIDVRAYDEAAARFRAALADPRPAIHRSAQAGLDALAARAR